MSEAPVALPAPTAPSRSAAPSKGLFLLASLGVLALDQWTKWLIEAHLPPHASFAVLSSWFHLTHVRNSGVAFGLFASTGPSAARLALVVLGIAALGIVAAYFWRTPMDRRRLLLALSLVLGGAVGNLMDRLASGAVTDFLDLSFAGYHWPAFNVADSAITVGLLLMAWDALRLPATSRD